MAERAVENQGYYSRVRGYAAEQLQPLDEMPATIGLQLFSIVPGIAGGIAGFLLAYRLAQTPKVRTGPLLLAVLGVALVTIGAVFLVKPAPAASAPALPPSGLP